MVKENKQMMRLCVIWADGGAVMLIDRPYKHNVLIEC